MPKSHRGPCVPLRARGRLCTLQTLQRSPRHGGSAGTDLHRPGAAGLPRVGRGGGSKADAAQMTAVSASPVPCPGAAASLRQLRRGPRKGWRRDGMGQTLSPQRPAPAPWEQAQRDAARGSLEAFREERGPGTRPAGKEVSRVCHSVCRSPDARPRRPSTNGVSVGADGRRVAAPGATRGRWAAGAGRRLAGQLNGALAVNLQPEGVKAPPTCVG